MGGGIRPVVPSRPSRAAAVLAVVALLLAAPFERGRGCDVCPVDCPMHRPASPAPRHVGCHQSPSTQAAAAHEDDGACAMRASCGHHGRAELVVFHAVLAKAAESSPVRVARPVLRDTATVVTADAPGPIVPPPEASLV